MPGLSDIARSFRTVAVGDVKVDVPGVSAEGIAFLFSRFPIIRELITGKSPELSADTLIKLGPEAVACIIAVGTGSGALDPERIDADAAVASRLPVETQLDLLDGILKETMPGGIGPFVDKLTVMFKGLGVESMNIPGGQSPSQSNS